MNVRWTYEALEDLDEIEAFIVEDNPERAVSFINELLDFGESLGNFPEKGVQARWTSDTSVREHYYENYTFIYEITGYEIVIHEVHNFAKMIRHFNR